MLETIKEKMGDNGIKFFLLFVIFATLAIIVLLGVVSIKKPREIGFTGAIVDDKNCQKKEREAEKNDCFDKLKMESAIREKNIKRCVEIKSVETRDDCIKTIASFEDLKNEKLCLFIYNISEKELCLLRVIVTIKDAEKCKIYFKDNFLRESECRDGVLSRESNGGKKAKEDIGSLPKEENVLSDTDKDGLLDVNEFFYGTDRFNSDTDGDGINDKQEVDGLTDPLGPGDMDFDGDGITDKEEDRHKTNPSLSDSDADGLFDSDEIFKYKTDPNKKDTDKDGFLDGDEIKNGYNPLGEGKLK